MTEFRTGDIVDVRGTVVRADAREGSVKVQFLYFDYERDPDALIWVRADTTKLVERPKPKAVVGDRVKIDALVLTVTAIDGEGFLMAKDANGARCTIAPVTDMEVLS